MVAHDHERGIPRIYYSNQPRSTPRARRKYGVQVASSHRAANTRIGFGDLRVQGNRVLNMADIFSSPGTPGEGQGEGLGRNYERRIAEASCRPSSQPSPGVPGEGECGCGVSVCSAVRFFFRYRGGVVILGRCAETYKARLKIARNRRTGGFSASRKSSKDLQLKPNFSNPRSSGT